jgi:hypothetical protein
MYQQHMMDILIVLVHHYMYQYYMVYMMSMPVVIDNNPMYNPSTVCYQYRERIDQLHMMCMLIDQYWHQIDQLNNYYMRSYLVDRLVDQMHMDHM